MTQKETTVIKVGSPKPRSLSVYAYEDYRSFLRDFYTEKKSRNASYSYRSFAIKAQLKSPNYLKLVIDGERRLTDRNLSAFLKGLGLEGHEALYFRFLTELSHESDPRRKTELLRRLEKLRNQATRLPHLITQARSRILEKWSYWIIRELASTKNFHLDAEWISRRLAKRVSPAEAQEAIDLLIDLEFIVPNDEGRYVTGQALVSSGDEEESKLVRNLHKQLITISLDSLEHDKMSEREFGAVTVALPKAKLTQAKDLMKRFRREFHQLMSEDDVEGDEVYQLNLAFFPLSKTTRGESR